MRTVKGRIWRAIAAGRPRGVVVLVSVAVTVGLGGRGMVRGPAEPVPAIVAPAVRVQIGHGLAVSCRLELGPLAGPSTEW